MCDTSLIVTASRTPRRLHHSLHRLLTARRSLLSPSACLVFGCASCTVACKLRQTISWVGTEKDGRACDGVGARACAGGQRGRGAGLVAHAGRAVARRGGLHQL